MLLQHAIRYHEACDWIRLQDPAALTYKSLLNHCKQLEQHCKQFQKAQLKGRAELTSLRVASTRTSIHQDSISTHPNLTNCYRCGYSHTNRDCPARGQRCYHCNNLGHFSHLCKSRYTNSHRYNTRRPSNRRHSSRSSSNLPVDHQQEAHHTIDAQEDTEAHTTSHWHSYHCRTQCSIKQWHRRQSNTTEKGKSRYPTPIPAKFFSFPTYSDTEDTSDTTSEISIVIHSQDEDNSSTNYNTISPPRNYHIPMTPPKTHKAMLPRPSHIPVLKTWNITKNQQNKDITTTQKVRPSLNHHTYQFSTTKRENQSLNQKFNKQLATFQDHAKETP